MDTILTYAYYKWSTTKPMGIIGMQADRFISEYHKMVRNGYSESMKYAGRLMCTCAQTDPAGHHYGFIIEADKDTTKAILELIDVDITESYRKDTMERLDKNLKGFDELIKETTAVK